ncbi:MAG: hypothetical protein J3Q66DRAFT_302685 [Benniella sp.]|nr:MAG: hypothetical protein J3Q66DRAFT_302685 [Benniella sp.]
MLMHSRKLIVSFVLVLNLVLILFYNHVSNLSSQALTLVYEPTGLEHARDLVPRPVSDPNERYLAYLPHSGFHNQRITLENALLLAKYLNRTLLVPPVFLGPATEWRFFNILHRRIVLQTKRGLDHCGRISKGEPLPAECLDYYSWTTVEWDFFYDMEKIAKQQPWMYRPDHSFAWMETQLGVDRKKDIYIIDDRAHYDYQIYDDPNSVTPLDTNKYMRRLDVKELADRPERVIHMGSLFATGRVLAELPENKEYQAFLRRTMILSTPILRKTSEAIVSKLGGLGSFVGLHLRVGDGMFVAPAPTNVENMFQQLINITGITPIPNYQTPTNPLPAEGDNTEGDKDQLPMVQEKVVRERLGVEACRERKAEGGKYTTIYIATDGVVPRRNPLFAKLFDHFPCIFTLDDFAAEHLVELKGMKNTDGVGLAKDLIPMVDAVVSAKGRYFMGTPKSTFSTYVLKQLHPAFVGELFDQEGNPL